MLSKLTLSGLHNYSNGALWDNLELPEGIDKEAFINEVLRQGAEFSLVYPDLDFMKYQIGAFCKKWYHNFERWIAAYNFEYEALYNLDVKSTITETGNNKENSSKAGSSSGSRNASGNGSSNGRNSGENDHYKAAYDSSNPVITEKDINSNISSLSTSENQSETSASSNSESMTSASEHSITTEEYRRGNQGITMSQEMLLAEFNAWYFNLYVHMAEIFINEFCICIYN